MQRSWQSISAAASVSAYASSHCHTETPKNHKTNICFCDILDSQRLGNPNLQLVAQTGAANVTKYFLLSSFQEHGQMFPFFHLFPSAVNVIVCEHLWLFAVLIRSFPLRNITTKRIQYSRLKFAVENCLTTAWLEGGPIWKKTRKKKIPPERESSKATTL